MLLYKKVDLVMQVLLIFSLVAYAILSSKNYALLGDGNYLLLFYFLLGGWQLLSCFIHGISENYYQDRDRKFYLRGVLIVFVAGVITVPAFIIYGAIMLFVSPILAVWYIMICYREIRMLRERRLFQLK